jgi:RND family efflux transporter MFP subunit
MSESTSSQSKSSQSGTTAGKPAFFSPKIAGLLLFVVLVFGGLFAAGMLPRRARVAAITEEAREDRSSLPAVTVAKAAAATPSRELVLPGSAAAIGETPVYARAEGYIKTRRVDIGDAVRAGDVLVEIDSPELDQQIATAVARLDQLKAALGQTRAAEQQSLAQAKLAGITRERVSRLVAEGVVSKQEGDNVQASYEIRQADVAAARAAIAVAEQAIRTQESEIARLREIEKFKLVRAPWDGVVTVRNCAVGNLITPSAIAQGRELFRVADLRVLRVFVSLPQADVPDVHAGQAAEVTIAGTARTFRGRISRLSNSVDPATRTQLTEILVANDDRALLPGMYVQAKIETGRLKPLVLIPGDTLITRNDGSYVAIVDGGSKVQFQKIAIGRDLGSQVEVLSGLQGGESLVVNPGDAVKPGVPVAAKLRK